MTEEATLTLASKDIERIVRDAKVREIVEQCSTQEAGRIGECVEAGLLDRLIELFAQDEDGLVLVPVSMQKWIETDPNPEDSDKCRTCALPVTIQWYRDELKLRNQSELAKRIESIGLSANPLTAAKELDNIKLAVDEETRKRLLDFDAATQANA